MSSELKTNKVSPATGTALQIGDSGDTITIPSGATLTNSGTATGFGGDNTPSFFARGSGTQAIADQTWTKVTLDTENWDTDSAFASDKFTVPSGEGGKYQFTYGGCMSELDDGEYYQFVLYKNGSEWSGGNLLGKIQDRMTGTNLGTSMNGSVAITLAATDYVELYVYHTEGGTNNLLNNQCYFQGWKLIGV
tara:strand:+ start:555 stop:1130 length:576 start_codon:yes stop_codon:yes gene_type:complete